ncbi:MAG: CoA ester lyase [Rhodococcus sp. (in: high G+C Gram-positive bacteria)]
MSWVPAGPAWLFCPADRPDRYGKAAAAADVVILDLEDAVTEADKPAARDALVATPQDPERTVIRVNACDTEHFEADLASLRRTRYRRVMLAKTESAAQVERLDGYEVVALIESPLGAVAIDDIVSAPGVVGAMWGAEDLVAALGGTSSRFVDGTYRDVARHVRASTLLAAKARGVFALDSVYLDIADLDGLAAESEDAVATGFDGKVAIHPRQVEVIRDAYRPSDEDVAWATRVLDAVSSNRGVFSFEDKMVDAPVLRHAEQILRRAASRSRPIGLLRQRLGGSVPGTS